MCVCVGERGCVFEEYMCVCVMLVVCYELLSCIIMIII